MPLAQRLLLKVSQVRPDHAHTVQHACVQRLTHAGRAMSMHIEILVLHVPRRPAHASARRAARAGAPPRTAGRREAGTSGSLAPAVVTRKYSRGTSSSVARTHRGAT